MKFLPKRSVDRPVGGGYGAGLLIVWPQAATAQYLADAHQNGMEVRCGFGDNLPYT